MAVAGAPTWERWDGGVYQVHMVHGTWYMVVTIVTTRCRSMS